MKIKSKTIYSSGYNAPFNVCKILSSVQSVIAFELISTESVVRWIS